MLYLVKRNKLVNGLNYYVEIDKSKTKILARYREGDKKIVSISCNSVWHFDSKEIRVYGPIDVRRKYAPEAPAKVSSPNPKEVNIRREDVISYLGGVSADTLSKELGISRDVFKRKLDQLGVLRKTGGDSPLTYRQLISYGQGLPIADIAKQGYMSEEHTLKKLRLLGLSLENFNLKNKVYRTDRVDFNLTSNDVKKYLEGTSINKLAHNYGTVERVVKNKLEILGVLKPADTIGAFSREQCIAIIKRKSISHIAGLNCMTKKEVMALLPELGIDSESYNLETSKSSRLEGV